MSYSKSNFVLFHDDETSTSRFTRKVEFEFDLVTFSRVVVRRFASTVHLYFVFVNFNLSSRNVQRRNYRNEILKTNFHIAWQPLINLFHRLCVTFFLSEHHAYFFVNKKAKYAENASFGLAYLLSRARNTTVRNRTNFSYTKKPWNANCENI